MESFYGGRQGNPFIIVKRFDGVDIPENTVYRTFVCAWDLNANNGNGAPILDDNNELILKTSKNQWKYPYWKTLEKNGTTIGNITLPTEYAEGMIQCFEKGGSSTSEVNYGEYVIIDTVFGLNQINNIDNGKVFRRGMDFNGELAGAEYIGCILGPQGESPEIEMGPYATIEEALSKTNDNEEKIYTGGTGKYTPTDPDMVPGAVLDYYNNVIDYNDEIKFAWLDIRDERGNIESCQFGFRFPYLILNFTAEPISPYFADTLIELGQTEEERNEHPFYREWHLKIPYGKKGKSFSDLEIVTLETRENVPYYEDDSLSVIKGFFPKGIQLNMGADYDNTKEYVTSTYGGETVYIKKTDTWKTMLRYKEIDYENSEEGDVRYVGLGSFNTIEKINVDEKGFVHIFYSYDGEKSDVEEKLGVGQLNFILETIITTINNSYGVPADHLLVLYSDTKYQGDITYYSERYQQEIKGYVDLGYIKGDPGPGMAVIAKYDSVNAIPKDPNNIPNYEPGKGVAVDTSIYIYDFNKPESWKYIGSINDVNPTEVVRVEPETTTVNDNLQENGVWFVTETMTVIE